MPVVDLPRIRRALAELDRIAAEHPELCQGDGERWVDNTEVLAAMITPVNERMKAYRRRLRERGLRCASEVCGGCLYT